MLADPSEYVWYSCQINALDKAADWCTLHLEYLKLGVQRMNV